jgi:hypothetical protein
MDKDTRNFILQVVVILLLGLGSIIVLLLVELNGLKRKDIQCKERFGGNWEYRDGNPGVCVNSGEAKYL